MAKGDKDLMPSTGSMIPSHTVETKVREEASDSDPLGHYRGDSWFQAHTPSPLPCYLSVPR